MELEFCDEHLDGLAKLFKDKKPAARPTAPVQLGDEAVAPALLDAEVVAPLPPEAGAIEPGTVDNGVETPELGGEGLTVPDTGVNGEVPVVYRGAITRSRANRN